jgi:hypothetical protein
MVKGFSGVIVLMFTIPAFHFLGAEVFMVMKMETACSSVTHLPELHAGMFFLHELFKKCPASRLIRLDGRMTDGCIGKNLEVVLA